MAGQPPGTQCASVCTCSIVCLNTKVIPASAAHPGTQSPDPAHPDDLLLIADLPGHLSVTVRFREGRHQRRATKSVTAVPDVTAAPPVTMRLFCGVGAGRRGGADRRIRRSPRSLGTFASSAFIALVAPLAALLGVTAVARGTGDAAGHPGTGEGL